MTYVAFIVSVVETMVSKRAVDLDETLLVLRLCETPHKGVKAGTPVCRVRVRKFSPTYFCACFSLLCLVMAPLVVNVRLPLPSLDGHNGHENTSPGLRRQLGPSLALGFAAPLWRALSRLRLLPISNVQFFCGISSSSISMPLALS